jgi:hypothetical protein
MAMQDLEGYDEAVRRMLEQLPLELRLVGLSPEQRLAGLSPEQRLLAMSDEALRMLRDEYLATFPEATREAVRKRLGG